MLNFNNDHSNCNSVRRSFSWFLGFYNDIMMQYGAILNRQVNDIEGYNYILKMFNCMINKNSDSPTHYETKRIKNELNSMRSDFAKENGLENSNMTDLKVIYDQCVLTLSHHAKHDMSKYLTKLSKCNDNRDFKWYSDMLDDIKQYNFEIINKSAYPREKYYIMGKLFNCLVNRKNEYPSRLEVLNIRQKLYHPNPEFFRESQYKSFDFKRLIIIFNKWQGHTNFDMIEANELTDYPSSITMDPDGSMNIVEESPYCNDSLKDSLWYKKSYNMLDRIYWAIINERIDSDKGNRAIMFLLNCMVNGKNEKPSRSDINNIELTFSNNDKISYFKNKSQLNETQFQLLKSIFTNTKMYYYIENDLTEQRHGTHIPANVPSQRNIDIPDMHALPTMRNIDIPTMRNVASQRNIDIPDMHALPTMRNIDIPTMRNVASQRNIDIHANIPAQRNIDIHANIPAHIQRSIEMHEIQANILAQRNIPAYRHKRPDPYEKNKPWNLLPKPNTDMQPEYRNGEYIVQFQKNKPTEKESIKYIRLYMDLEQLCIPSFTRDENWYYAMFALIDELYKLYRTANNKGLFMLMTGIAFNSMVRDDSSHLTKDNIQQLKHMLFNHEFQSKSRLDDARYNQLKWIYTEYMNYNVGPY